MSKVAIILAGLMMCAGIGSASDKWYDNLKLSGDLRYRHELIEDDINPSRNRHRIRARLGLKAEINEYAKVGFQLASGSDDPVSTNQTLDGGFSSKGLVLNQAYFEITHHRADGVLLSGGKFKSPFFAPGKTEVIFDSDLGMEGGYLLFQSSGKIVDYRFIVGGFWVEERSSESDSYIVTKQVQIDFELIKDKIDLVFAVGLFNYNNASGHPLFFDVEDGFGNSTKPYFNGTDTILTYANGFEIVDISAQLNLKFGGQPILLYGESIKNNDADSLETGYLIGISLGKTKKPGSWNINYNYRKLEKDAVVGAFSNSDFGGGGTNAKGHKIGAAFQLADKMAFALTYFVNETEINQDKTKDYKRLQADLKLKF